MPYVRFGAQFLFAGALLALLFWRVNVGQVGDELSDANLWWLIPAFVFNLMSDFFRAIRWREFFRPMRKLGVGFLWLVAMIGVACNQAMPLRAGEFVRMQLLRRRTGLELPQVIATILSEKLMDTVAFSAFLVLGIVLYPEARFLWPLAVLYICLLAAGVVGARMLSARSMMDAPIDQPAGPWRGWTTRHLRSFGTGLQSFRNARSLAIISVASVAAWLMESVLYYSCGQALGLDLDPAVYLLVVVAATVAVSVPLTQAGIGVFEVALTGLLVAFGVDKSEAVAFAIFSHVMLAVPYFVAGPLAAIVLRVNLDDVLFWRGGAQEANDARDA